MKELFILSNLNERELLRSFSKIDKFSFGVHVLNSKELALEVLIRNGIINTNKSISNIKATSIIKELCRDNEYFRDSSFKDSKNILRALNELRMYETKDNQIEEVLSNGEFIEKNKALLEVYKKYIEYLKDNDYNDDICIINEVINNNLNIDSEFIIFEEENFKPLEIKLLEVISKGNYKKTSILNYLNKEVKKLSDISYDSAYGSVNEVDSILAYIGKNRIKYDDCLIVNIDSSYLSNILNASDHNDIPFTYGDGLPISLTSGAKVFNLLINWDNNYHCYNALNDLINSKEFDGNKFFKNISDKELNGRNKDNLLKTLGNLAISTKYDEKKLNEYRNSLEDDSSYLLVENASKELGKGYSYLIKTYSVINSSLDEIGVNKLCSYLDEYLDVSNENKIEDIKDEINNLSINKELSNEGKIHVCNLNSALSIYRKHVFICGLNASVFPGSPKEDYLLLDSDLDLFKDELVKNSNGRIKDNKDLLMNVIKLLNALGSKIHLSYSSYNLSELKDENPSSMLYEVYKEEKGEEVSIKDLENDTKYHKYFDEELSNLKDLGQKYLKGNDLIVDITNEDEVKKVIKELVISPSSAEQFFECPKRFYLRYVLGIKEEDEDDPFKILPANDEGTLIHKCMEDYGNNENWSKEEFMANASKLLNDYFKQRIPLHTKGMEKITRDYLDMAEAGYDRDPHNKVVVSEYKLGPYKHLESGISFGGTVDRIEKLDNGNYKIVDYKTYKDIRNIEDDIDTCLQVIIYAYIYEETTGNKIESCEYRYLRNINEISCIYNEDMKKLMNNKLLKIKEALESGVFGYGEDEACKYCKYSKICGKEEINE